MFVSWICDTLWPNWCKAKANMVVTRFVYWPWKLTTYITFISLMEPTLLIILIHITLRKHYLILIPSFILKARGVWESRGSLKLRIQLSLVCTIEYKIVSVKKISTTTDGKYFQIFFPDSWKMCWFLVDFYK